MKVEKYEVVFILQPELEKEALDQACDKIKDLITKENGTIVDTIFWGKRKLAYNIKKFEKGIYVIMLVDIDTQAVQTLRSKFNIMQDIIRFMFSQGYKIKKMPVPEEIREHSEKTERPAETTEAPTEKAETPAEASAPAEKAEPAETPAPEAPAEQSNAQEPVNETEETEEKEMEA